MNKFLYNAKEYSLRRPTYPESLYSYLANLCQNKNVTLDCGAGSGQAAFGLKKYFKIVIATDLSYELLSTAPKEKKFILHTIAS